LDVQGDGRQQQLDLATTARIKAVLLADADLKSERIAVETFNGAVRLTGQVSSTTNLARAKDVVWPVDGVKTVENMLVVREVVKPL
jgi:osmotically-inducible protein OsmY